MAGLTLSLSLPLLPLLFLPLTSPHLIPPTFLDPPPLSSRLPPSPPPPPPPPTPVLSAPQTPSTLPPASKPSPTPSTPPSQHHAKPPDLVSFTGGKGSYKSMSREFLQAHNEVRQLVGQKPYVWDKKLARYARRWAEQRREKCDTTHSQGPYGENMFWGTGWDWKAKQAVQNWAKERVYYNRTDRTCWPGKMCGHFTQIVWNSTVKVGCARVECYRGGVIISCNYDPPGNFVGEDPFTS